MFDINHLGRYSLTQINSEQDRLNKSLKFNKFLAVVVLLLTILLFIASIICFGFYIKNYSNNSYKYVAILAITFSSLFALSLIVTLFVFIRAKLKIINPLREINKYLKSNER